ncbi:MAG TPA: TIM barrel protein [Rariglobus sp.]|nr:TIM barrel protein [Rariglobus sp.]
MKIAGSTLIFSELPLVDTIQRVADLGFRYIDLALIEGWANLSPSTVVGHETEVSSRLLSACEASGIRPAGLNLGLGQVSVEIQIERIQAVGKIACRLGVTTLTIGASRPQLSSLANEINRLRRLTVETAAQGLTLNVETHLDTCTEDPDICLQLVREVPGLGITLDLTHFAIGPFWKQGYEALLPFVRHVHLRPSGRNRDDEIQVAVGDGVIDFNKLIRDLNRHAYQGTLSVEYVSAIPGVDHLAESRRLHQHVTEITARHQIALE